MKKYIILSLIVIIAGAAAYFIFSGESEEARIRKVLTTLCRMTTKRSGDNAAAAALMISKTDRIFANEFTIRVGKGMFDGVLNPTKMTSELARYRSVFTDVKTDAQDIEIFFQQEDKATAVFSGTLSGDTKTGKSISEARDVECSLVKTPEGWKISKMIIREVLEK